MGNSLKTLREVPAMDQQEQLPEIELENQEHLPETTEVENQEFTCEICVEPTDKKFKNKNKCCHPFCTDCMIKYITVKLEEDNVGHIKCPALNCDHTLDPFSCSSLVGPKIFLRWSDVLCEEALCDLEKCYCPYNNCSIMILNECGGNPKKSKCPSCKRWLCFQCKSVWHAGFSCDESREAMMDFNNVVFGRLVERRKWSRCPKCRHFVESSGGCSAIRCRCGITFCYSCGELFRRNRCGCKSRNENRCCEGILMLVIFILLLGSYCIYLFF